jgi:hypothetical protein
LEDKILQRGLAAGIVGKKVNRVLDADFSETGAGPPSPDTTAFLSVRAGAGRLAGTETLCPVIRTQRCVEQQLDHRRLTECGTRS